MPYRGQKRTVSAKSEAPQDKPRRITRSREFSSREAIQNSFLDLRSSGETLFACSP
jgi:hypothetical protein